MRVGRFLSFLALPLSVVPVLAVVPQIQASREHSQREGLTALAPVSVALTPAEQQRFRPLPATHDAVPVLAYHGISEGTPQDARSISQRTFAQQLAALRAMGYQAISMRQYVRFQRGDTAGLPARPLLITFDDSRLDAYRGADEVLAQAGMRATMFVAADQVDRGDAATLTWKELRRMSDSRRWDIEPGTSAGATDVTVDEQGTSAPFYAQRRYTRWAGRESLVDYEQRVTLDVFAARDAMTAHGFDASAFAAPVADSGPDAPTEPAAASFLGDLLHRQFPVVFTRADGDAPAFTRPGRPAQRYEIGSSSTTDRLYRWLRDGAPKPAAKPAPKPAARPVKRPVRHQRHAAGRQHHQDHHARKG
jgi:hypothetical protein